MRTSSKKLFAAADRATDRLKALEERREALRVFLIETQSGLHEDAPAAIKAAYGRGMCEFKRLNQQVETAKTQQALLTRLGEFRLKMETAGLEF